jgi:probable O-glycosylation ligase (exosortase A-associated)
MILALGAFFTLTTLVALVPQNAWKKWELVIKIYTMTVVSLFLLQDRRRLRYLVLTVALSIAFFSVKGGFFSLLTGGRYTLYGPVRTFIDDNNALALAELMILPLLFHLGRIEKNRLFGRFLYVSAFLTLASIIFSYSRGALVGLAALALVFVASGKKWTYAAVAFVIFLAALPVIPDAWFQRMSTIGTYQHDASAMGRINAWHFAINVAVDRPLTGGGFRVFNDALFAKYAPNPWDIHDAHSIYFEVLGEHGFIGLGLFLGLMFSCFRSLAQVRRWIAGNDSVAWAGPYCMMLRQSLVAFAVGGAFLGLAYFDLYGYLVVAIVLLKIIVRDELSEEAAAPPAEAEPPAAAPARAG